ncbi:diamine acetyltransferase [Rodentibacter caecimuris]|uniref:Diamine acetyltransferase n=1 Tax=Rodentibacter caecimuris TaxID=1796644 RepID=A0A9X8VX01_9PAST|nr:MULTISPECIES: GNAT family N-acetyltransferase [Pasteurellaceae]AOF54046.1 Histone acetyltransferase HPA2-related acetyltransferase [Pasteurellaceae bacterium NI1060]MCQ9124666.1 GNAT family N-acetyltransferase [Rodentibacter heylii]MCR1837477.1 GNAT family N-acetyltransferase [Pasteurella caecimuris]MCU0106887.1 GNAT family N-acetyltransferase [Pasteurella caecimuris]MCX2960494.1 GNAT family N-acetyltransferase [Rodentibacter heylii]
MNILIRKAQRQDCNKMWRLMKELAIFEHYIDSFAITPEIVEECGFNKNPPDFYCLVAADKENIVGIAVYYFLPYTAQNRPAIYLKELYIDEHYRGQQIGEKLMQALKVEAQNHGCLQIKWTVAPWNEAGKHFYEKLGAQQNNEWLNYEWKIN